MTTTAPAAEVTAVHAALERAVDAVVAQPLADLWPDELQAQIAVIAAQAQRLAGFVSLATGELHRRTGGQLTPDAGGRRSVIGWVAEATRSSAAAAGSLVRTATALESLPLVAQAVVDGLITLPHAQVLARLVGRLDPAALVEAQQGLVELARIVDPSALGLYVRHLLATWSEPALEAEAEAARSRRCWQSRLEPDGVLRGRFVLPAEDAEVLLTVMEPLARRQGEQDDRSAAQRRADALVEVFQQAARSGELPEAGGARPQLSYVLPADWAARQTERSTCAVCSRCPQHRSATLLDTVLAGLPARRPEDESGSRGAPGIGGSRGSGGGRASGAGSGRTGVLPAEHACAVAAWTGPQTRARIETILCEARITRVLLDQTGQVAGLESLTDAVTPAQRRALAARDLGCAARGCSRPPAVCDAHHLTARADGGPTTLDNLALLCRRHHVLWHLGKIGLPDLHVPWLGPDEPDPPDGWSPRRGHWTAHGREDESHDRVPRRLVLTDREASAGRTG